MISTLEDQLKNVGPVENTFENANSDMPCCKAKTNTEQDISNNGKESGRKENKQSASGTTFLNDMALIPLIYLIGMRN